MDFYVVQSVSWLDRETQKNTFLEVQYSLEPWLLSNLIVLAVVPKCLMLYC